MLESGNIILENFTGLRILNISHLIFNLCYSVLVTLFYLVKATLLEDKVTNFHFGSITSFSILGDISLSHF